MKLLKVYRVAQLLDATERHVRKLIADGDLPAIRIGRQLRVSEEALEAWIKAGGSRKSDGAS